MVGAELQEPVFEAILNRGNDLHRAVQIFKRLGCLMA